MLSHKLLAGGPDVKQHIAVAHTSSPYVTAYPYSTGFGTKYSNPSTLPTGDGRGVAFHPDGTAIAVAHNTSPFLTIYEWTPSGFGTKYADPATLPPSGTITEVVFSPDGRYVAVGSTTSPFVAIYPWSLSGFGAKLADNLVSGPGASVLGINFVPTEDVYAIAFGQAGGVNLVVCNFSGSGLGVRFTSPATLPTGFGRAVAFDKSASYLAVGHDTTPFISVYPWSRSGFGTKYANPASLPTDSCWGVAFHPESNAIVAASLDSPWLHAWQWSSAGFGTKYTAPSTTGTLVAATFVAFNRRGTDVAAAFESTADGRLQAWPWTYSGGFGTRRTSPGTTPTGYCYGVAFGETYG